jgi:hypothetical protein
LGAMFFFLSNLAFPDSAFSPKKDKKTNLYPDQAVSQVFRSDRNGLTGLAILFKDNSLGWQDKIILELFDADCEKNLAREEINYFSALIENTEEFKFPPIPGSRDNLYCLKVTFKTASGRTKNFPDIWTNDTQTQGFGYINSGEKEKTSQRMLALRPLYSQADIGENLQELNQRMSQYKPWFFKDGYLTILVLLFLIATLATAVILIAL